MGAPPLRLKITRTICFTLLDFHFFWLLTIHKLIGDSFQLIFWRVSSFWARNANKMGKKTKRMSAKNFFLRFSRY